VAQVQHLEALEQVLQTALQVHQEQTVHQELQRLRVLREQVQQLEQQEQVDKMVWQVD